MPKRFIAVLYLHTYIHTRTHTHTQANTLRHICTHSPLRLRAHTHMYTHTHTHTHPHTHTHTHITNLTHHTFLHSRPPSLSLSRIYAGTLPLSLSPSPSPTYTHTHIHRESFYPSFSVEHKIVHAADPHRRA